MKYSIKELPKSERPRERLEKQGVKSLSEAELLSLVIRSGTKNKNVLDVSKEILKEFRLSRMNNLTMSELKEFKGIGKVKAGQIKAVFELSRRLSRDEKEVNGKIKCFEDAVKYINPILTNSEEEKLIMICLDSRNKLISKNFNDWTVTEGSINRINVNSRQIVKKALKQNAAAVILAHNHPGGNSEPTEEDIGVTKEIKNTIEKLDINLLDHIIVSKKNSVSLRKKGLIF